MTVPANTSLKLNLTHGSITVDGVHGEIDAETTHGDINLNNVSGTVVANTVHGSLRASMNQVDQSKPLSFTTLNGDIDVDAARGSEGQRKTARPARRDLERFRYETDRQFPLDAPLRQRQHADHDG